MQTGARDWRTRAFTGLEGLLCLCLALAMLLPYSPANQAFPSRDSGVFMYTGWRIQNGEVPYLNVWDHKPPVIFYLNALGLSLGGVWGVWFIELLSLGAAAGMAYYLLKRLFGIFPAIFVSFAWLFSLYYILAGGNLTTEYTLPMQFGALALFYEAESKDRYGWRGVLLGGLTALAFFTRQNAIGIPLAIGLFLVISRLHARQFRKLLIELGSLAAGALAVSLLVVGYFAVAGALPQFWDSAFIYNFSYVSERGYRDRLDALLSGLLQLRRYGLAQLALPGWGVGLALLLLRKDRFAPGWRSLMWTMIAALPLEFWLVSLSGRPRTPYFLALLPVLAFFVAATLSLLFDRLARPGSLTAIAALLTALGLVAAGHGFPADYVKVAQGYARSRDSLPAVAYIAANSAPDDTVLMWGAETAYNFAARRRSPTRFVYQYPLIKGGYSDEAKMSEFFGDILREKPRLIIVTGGNGRMAGSAFGYSSVDTRRLIDRVKDIYDVKEVLDSWTVYEYNGK